jgi:single-strand DNA-binding protein
MAKSFNQAIIMGNLTRDPELRNTPSGQSVASFAVATNRVWQDGNGEKQEAADFHEVVAWGKLAELASQYLAKGRKVLVVGRLQTRSWEGQDGQKRQRTEIVANDISFLDGPSGSRGGEFAASDTSAKSEEKPAKSKDVVIEDIGDDSVNLDEIPF